MTEDKRTILHIDIGPTCPIATWQTEVIRHYMRAMKLRGIGRVFPYDPEKRKLCPNCEEWARSKGFQFATYDEIWNSKSYLYDSLQCAISDYTVEWDKDVTFQPMRFMSLPDFLDYTGIIIFWNLDGTPRHMWIVDYSFRAPGINIVHPEMHEQFGDVIFNGIQSMVDSGGYDQ